MSRKLGKFEKKMAEATTYAEWQDAAKAHDAASGAERWRQMDQSRRYDYLSIRVRLDQLRELRGRGDNQGLLFTLNEGIHGNMGGMGNSKLYSRARFGTKSLISQYVAEINNALEYLARPEVDDIPLHEKLDFFHRAQHCYGCSALMLSGSGSFLYFHVGVVKALWENDLLPSVLSGSSGGAVIAAIVGTHKDDALTQMFDPRFLLEEVHKEMGGLKRKFSAFQLRSVPTKMLYETIDRLVPDMTFQEAAELTGYQINVSIAPSETHQSSRLLNAIASPNVYIRDGLRATTAVPSFYPPVMLMAKNIHGERQPYLPSRRWVDGAVSDDLPAKRLARLYGVNHYIVSQTNPVVLPFIQGNSGKWGPLQHYRKAAQIIGREVINANINAWQKQLSRFPWMERSLSMGQSIMNQRYTGDINIFPSYRLVDPRKVVKVWEEKEVMDLIRAGERAGWEKLEMIRLQSTIGRTLDRLVPELEKAMLAPDSARGYRTRAPMAAAS